MRRNRAEGAFGFDRSDRLLNIRALRGPEGAQRMLERISAPCRRGMPISATKDLIADRHMALLSISPVASLPSLASQGLSEAT